MPTLQEILDAARRPPEGYVQSTSLSPAERYIAAAEARRAALGNRLVNRVTAPTIALENHHLRLSEPPRAYTIPLLEAAERYRGTAEARRTAIAPSERERIRYNQQLQDYYEQQHRYEYQNQTNSINQNQQNYSNQGFGQNMSVSRPIINELISMINSQPTRYVPIRPRPSINDRVMNSFGQNMFSPEFIPEEE